MCLTRETRFSIKVNLLGEKRLISNELMMDSLVMSVSSKEYRVSISWSDSISQNCDSPDGYLTNPSAKAKASVNLGFSSLISSRFCANDLNDKLEHYTQNDFFKGLRHIVQDEEDDFFMLRDDFQQGISQLQKFDLTYDILIYPKQFEAAIALTQNFRNQYFVLDHFGKPQYNLPIDMNWAEQIEQLADQPKVYCKLSGIFTEIQTKPWQMEQILPYLDHVVRCFGMDRLLYGSDWPVCLLSSNFNDHLDLLKSYFSLSDRKEIEKVFSTNCIHFYDL